MLRMPNAICRPYVEGMTILDAQTEDTLLRWQGTAGPSISLRTLDDWRRLWGQWGDTIMAKAIEHRPGLRPAALYVLGTIPPPRMVRPLPAFHAFATLYVNNEDGTGRQWVIVGEPYRENEAAHLYREGIIDDEELRRHREWQRTRQDTYPHEQGLYR